MDIDYNKCRNGQELSELVRESVQNIITILDLI